VVAPTIPVLGRAEVSDALVDLMGPATGWTSTVVDVNGAPAMVFRDGSRVAAVLNLRIQFRRVAVLWAVLNPDKLRHWNTP
jgi:RNA polymerase sigma-70 factor (ECF subfamily)